MVRVTSRAYFALSATQNITSHIIQVTQLLLRPGQYLFPPTLRSVQLKTHSRALNFARPSLDGPLFVRTPCVDSMTHSELTSVSRLSLLHFAKVLVFQLAVCSLSLGV